MARSRSRAYRIWAVAALLLSAGLTGIGLGPAASADVTEVKGSAYAVFASVGLFGGPAMTRGPIAQVTLPAGGSATPITGTVEPPAANAIFGPATIFSTGTVNTSTQGTTGPNGSVTSTASLGPVNTSDSEVFTASSISSTCTASETGTTGSTTITGGTLILQDPNPDTSGEAGEEIVTLAANPAPNTTYTGRVANVNDDFRAVFNEQTTGADGTLTVNAYHLYLLGPTAIGELIVGQVGCDVTVVAATTTTTSGVTPTTAGGTTTTTAGTGTTTSSSTSSTSTTSSTSSTSTTAAGGATTTTSGATGGTVNGGAIGFRVTVGLFGGPAATKGPEPTVTLPAGGSAAPVTANLPSGIAQFGPATLYTSDALTVSTQGTPGGTVTSSAKATNVNKSTVNAAQTGSESFTADSVSSTCSASSSGATGSSNMPGASLVTSVGTNFDSEVDDVKVAIPADPAPNTTFRGKIENVGDEFRIVFNEQETSAGSITVNAVHLYLEGPIAKGDLIIGQSRCGFAATGGTGTGTGTGGVGGVGGLSATGGVASTGTNAAPLIALGLLLVVIGGHVGFGLPGIRLAEADPATGGTRRRRMPWTRRPLRSSFRR